VRIRVVAEYGSGRAGVLTGDSRRFSVSGEDPRVAAPQQETAPESAQARASDRACAAEPKP